MSNDKTTLEMKLQTDDKSQQCRRLTLSFKQNTETFHSLQLKKQYGERGPKNSQRPFMFLRPYMNSPHLKLLQKQKNLPIIAKSELHQISSQKHRNYFDFFEPNNYINMSDVVDQIKPETIKYLKGKNQANRKIQIKNQYICKVRPPNTLTNFTINQKLAIQRRKTLSISSNNEITLEKSHRVNSLVLSELNQIPNHAIKTQENIMTILRQTQINFDEFRGSDPITQDKFFVRENNFTLKGKNKRTR